MCGNGFVGLAMVAAMARATDCSSNIPAVIPATKTSAPAAPEAAATIPGPGQ
jgi:hypothetical protein